MSKKRPKIIGDIQKTFEYSGYCEGFEDRLEECSLASLACFMEVKDSYAETSVGPIFHSLGLGSFTKSIVFHFHGQFSTCLVWVPMTKKLFMCDVFGAHRPVELGDKIYFLHGRNNSRLTELLKGHTISSIVGSVIRTRLRPTQTVKKIDFDWYAHPKEFKGRLVSSLNHLKLRYDEVNFLNV